MTLSSTFLEYLELTQTAVLEEFKNEMSKNKRYKKIENFIKNKHIDLYKELYEQYDALNSAINKINAQIRLYGTNKIDISNLNFLEIQIINLFLIKSFGPEYGIDGVK